MPPRAAASEVAEGTKAADHWLAVEREPYAAVSQHLLIDSLKAFVAGIAKLHGALPNAVNLGPSFNKWMIADEGARKLGSTFAVTGLSGNRNVSFVLEPAQVPASVLNRLLPNLAAAGINKDTGWDGKLTQDECRKIEALGESCLKKPTAPVEPQLQMPVQTPTPAPTWAQAPHPPAPGMPPPGVALPGMPPPMGAGVPLPAPPASAAGFMSPLGTPRGFEWNSSWTAGAGASAPPSSQLPTRVVPPAPAFETPAEPSQFETPLEVVQRNLAQMQPHMLKRQQLPQGEIYLLDWIEQLGPLLPPGTLEAHANTALPLNPWPGAAALAAHLHKLPARAAEAAAEADEDIAPLFNAAVEACHAGLQAEPPPPPAPAATPLEPRQMSFTSEALSGGDGGGSSAPRPFYLGPIYDEENNTATFYVRGGDKTVVKTLVPESVRNELGITVTHDGRPKHLKRFLNSNYSTGKCPCRLTRPVAGKGTSDVHTLQHDGFGSIAIVVQLDAKEGVVTAELPEATVSSAESIASKRQRRRPAPGADDDAAAAAGDAAAAPEATEAAVA